MVKISVILPIYNVEDYLEETLNCLLNQTILDDIEVLMIDDGSTDDSRYIIEKYALDYENFHAFHKINEGQGIARNFALKLAKGDYIHFLDSDDYLSDDAYEVLYDCALKNDSDIVIGDVLRFDKNNLWSDKLFINSFSGISHDIESTTLNQSPSLLWDSSTSNKLYKKEFLLKNDIKFPDKKIFFEDLVFSIESYIKADSIYISKYVFYYWRLRGKKTSVTQKNSDVKNFYDRLEILKIIDNLMKNNNLSKDLIYYEYKKWLNHDLKIFLKRLTVYPEDFHQDLVDEVKEVLKLIPNEFLDELNSFNRVLYQMVNDNNVEALLSYAHLEKEFDFDTLDEKYKNLVDLDSDVKSENLKADLLNIESNENELYLEFDEKIKYLNSNFPHQTFAYLIDNQKICSNLKVDDNRIIVPFDLMKNKKHLNIKIEFISEDFSKEAHLTYKKRKSLEFNDFYIDFGVSVDHLLFIDRLEKNDIDIEIDKVSFNGDDFIFEGKSNKTVDEVFIQNYVSCEVIEYPLEKSDDGFRFIIPYNDILNVPIKKWELNCSESLNSINLTEEYKFYHEYNKIKISNQRNKIIIENDLLNNIEELNIVNNQVYELISENQELEKYNEDLDKENNELLILNENLNQEIDILKLRRCLKVKDSLKKFIK